MSKNEREQLNEHEQRQYIAQGFRGILTTLDSKEPLRWLLFILLFMLAAFGSKCFSNKSLTG